MNNVPLLIEPSTINTMPANLGISHDPYEVVPAEAERIFA